MELCPDNAAMRQLSARWRAAGLRIGYVPTMGALHAGHLSLLELARADCDRVVVGIYVNPAQFGPAEDFLQYPRPLAEDQALLAAAGADALYLAQDREMYPPGAQLRLELPELSSRLEGIHRPGHFAGVALIVTKLLNVVRPDLLYLGQKDYQQTVVLRQLLAELLLTVELRVGPTVREPDGLALSSRNRYLSPEERQRAPRLYQVLQAMAQQAQHSRSVSALRTTGLEMLAAESAFILHYLEVLQADTLAPFADESWQGRAVILLAAQLGRTRLLDNILLSEMHPRG